MMLKSFLNGYRGTYNYYGISNPNSTTHQVLYKTKTWSVHHYTADVSILYRSNAIFIC